jgi:thioesterase domain-containing protein
MAAAFINEIRAVQPHGPYRLGGFCEGGMLMYEVARQLEVEGETIDSLVLVAGVINTRDHWLYSLAQRVLERTTPDPVRRLQAIRQLRYYRRRLGDALSSGMRSLGRQTSRDELEIALAPEGATDTVVEQTEEQKRAFQIHWRAVNGWVPKRYRGKVTLLLPDDDIALAGPKGGWQVVVRNIETVRVPGSHVSCVTEHLDDVARAIIAQFESSPASSAQATP